MNRVSLFLAVFYIFEFAVIAIWDVWIIASGVPEQTVSAIISEWCRRFPLLSAFIGGLVIHLLAGFGGAGGPALVPPPRGLLGAALVLLSGPGRLLLLCVFGCAIVLLLEGIIQLSLGGF